jgi:hypothetical protein
VIGTLAKDGDSHHSRRQLVALVDANGTTKEELLLRRLLCALFLLASLAGVAVAAPSATALTATGSISGVVTNAAATPEEFICVYAIGQNTGKYQATTNASGDYTISDLPEDQFKVEFDPSCGETVTSTLAIQFYDGQSQDGEPDLVGVNNNAVGSIDAALEPGSTISGTITNSISETVANVCVTLYSANGNLFPLGGVSSTGGTYSITSLPYGTYKVLFDPTCDSSKDSPYAYQYYNNTTAGTAALGSALGVTISAPAGATGINASLVAGASISGSLSVPGSPDPEEVCVNAVTISDSFKETYGVTDSHGNFEITNLPPATYEIMFDPTCSGTQNSDYLPVVYDGGSGQTITAGENVTGLTGALSDPATPVQITTTSLPATLPAASYSETVQADDGTLPYQWSARGLPLGFSINAATGVISGTTTATGAFPVSVTVIDSAVPPVAATLNVSLTVGETPTATTTTTSTTTTTTTTTVPKTKSVCAPKTKIVTTDKVEVKDGKRTVVVTHKTVDVRKTVAVKTTKKVDGKSVVEVTHKREVVEVCKTETVS